MKSRSKSSRRSHAMLRAAGISEAASLPVSAFRGSCCKMFFPMTETVGTTITDAIGGVVMTPAAIEFGVFSNAVAFEFYSALNTGLAPTTGTIPDVGALDCILFQVHRFRDGYSAGRPAARFNIGDLSVDSYGIADGDAVTVYGPTGTAIAKLDNFIGMVPESANFGAQALVRRGRDIGCWLHNSFSETPNAWVGNGDVFCETPLDAHILYNGAATSTEFTADYALEGNPITENVVSTPTLGLVSGGYPGIWGHLPEGYAMPYQNKLTTGITNPLFDLSVPRYGVALFAFQNGLPDDWKEALRWMRDQWLAGNKAIWPDWVSVA